MIMLEFLGYLYYLKNCFGWCNCLAKTELIFFPHCNYPIAIHFLFFLLCIYITVVYNCLLIYLINNFVCFIFQSSELVECIRKVDALQNTSDSLLGDLNSQEFPLQEDQLESMLSSIKGNIIILFINYDFV